MGRGHYEVMDYEVMERGNYEVMDYEVMERGLRSNGHYEVMGITRSGALRSNGGALRGCSKKSIDPPLLSS